MAGRLAAALCLLLVLPCTQGLEAGETASAVFWLAVDPTSGFPSALVESKGISIETLEMKPAVCAPPAEPDPSLEERVREGIDLFYTNDFKASESTLREVWEELGKGKDVLDIPSSWISECFAFRMLIFRASGMGLEAEALAREATGAVHPSLLEDLDLPPDGHAYILEQLEQASARGYTLRVSMPQGQDACSLRVDGVRQPSAVREMKFEGGVHWIRAACGADAGWTWRVEFPLHDGATLYLDPGAESRCTCGDFPLVACSDPGAEVLTMASNLMIYPRIGTCFVVRETADEEGFLLSDAIAPFEGEPPGLQALSWVRLGKPPKAKKGMPAQAQKSGRKPRLYLPALVLAAAGSAAAGVSIGLGAGSVHAADSAYTQKDPWVRAQEVEEASRLESAALITAGVAVSLLVTSLIYHIVVYKKHKEAKKSQ